MTWLTGHTMDYKYVIPVDNFGTVVGENPDCLLLSGTVVGEIRTMSGGIFIWHNRVVLNYWYPASCTFLSRKKLYTENM